MTIPDITGLLERSFSALNLPPEGGDGLRFAVDDFPGANFAKIAKSQSGGPALLLSVTRTGIPPQELRLKNLVVLFEAPCRITNAAGTKEATFAVVSYEGDAGLHLHFLQAAAAFVGALGDHPSETDVDQVLRSFVEVFRAASIAPRRSTRGLWGELLLIGRARSPGRMVEAWHGDPSERYDFAEGSQRIEVKTCGRHVRAHHFSLEQLTGVGVEAFVASVVVEPSSAGESIQDLVRGISATLALPAEVANLVREVTATLGTEWRDFSAARFDRELAHESIQFFRANDIPRVAEPLALGVSQVSFVSDLSGLVPLSKTQLREIGGLLSMHT